MFKLFEKIKSIFIKKPKSKYLVFKDDNVKNLDEVLKEDNENNKVNLAFEEENENDTIKLGTKSFNIKYLKKAFFLNISYFFYIFPIFNHEYICSQNS